MPARPTSPGPALRAARALLAAALALLPGRVAADSLEEVIERVQAMKAAPPAAGEALAAVIEAAQELKRAVPPPAASPLGDVIAAAQDLKRTDVARPRAGVTDAVLDRAQELKRRFAKEPPPRPPPPSVGRLVDRVQELKRQAAEAAAARDRETAALIREVEPPPSPDELKARKEAFIRDRLDPMLGERRNFLVNLDQHIRKHGILAFVAGLSDVDKQTSAALVRITEEQRALMAANPDLFTDDDLHSSQVLTDLLKLLAQ